MPEASVTMVIPGSTIVIGTLGKVVGITGGTVTGGVGGITGGGTGGVTGGVGTVSGGDTGDAGTVTGGDAGDAGDGGSTVGGLSTIHNSLTISFSKFMRQIYETNETL